MQKSAIYREKEICDTTWDTVFVNDTLGLERVDTTIEVVMEEIVHVSSAGKMMLTIGHRECRKFVQIRVPSVSWTKGFEPKVTFYAAHQESDRWLADAMGGILAVAFRIPIDFLSKIPKGRTFRAGCATEDSAKRVGALCQSPKRSKSSSKLSGTPIYPPKLCTFIWTTAFLVGLTRTSWLGFT